MGLPHRAHSASHAAAIGTKIVATIGPATSSSDQLARLITAGVNVVRINFSHGSRAVHESLLAAARTAAADADRTIAVLGDLAGPKIRLRKIKDGEARIDAGATLRLDPATALGDASRAGINYPEVFEHIEVGQRVLIDDGALCFRVTSRRSDELACLCEVGGVLRDHKGVNLPDSDLPMPALTEQDCDNVRWAVASELDYLALSFVRRAEDVHALRRFVRENQGQCHIVSKIETPLAVSNIEPIIEASDAILVARGDLGVELDVAHVPRIQKNVISACRRAGKPVIVATQMLQSMIDAPAPTRAEVSDVANAIVDGADALMLSGETAIGKYPIEAVEMMVRIAADTEHYDQAERVRPPVNEGHPGVTAAVADSISSVVARLTPQAVVVWTEEGVLARLVSRYRLDQPVIALTPRMHVCRRLALYYGVFACRADHPADPMQRMTAIDDVLIPHGWVARGDLVVAGIGPHSLDEGDTGAIVIRIVGAKSKG